MKNLDITVDLETTALCPTAAIISIGAVAWDRDNDHTPFLTQKNTVFSQHVDLRSSFLDGLTIDKKTSDWWAKQEPDAKNALLQYDEIPLTPVKDVLENFFCWIEETKERYNAESVNLWSQGSDFDIAIIRNICYKYGINIPVHYTHFRDHRTFFLETASTLCDMLQIEFNPRLAYNLVEEYKEKSVPHDPVFDCKRSIYSSWQMMKKMRQHLKK